MNTPTPRPALKATGMRRRHARCLETELAALTAERDQLRAEVERLRSDRDCEKRLRKDAEELREDAIERAMKAEAERDALSKVKAHLFNALENYKGCVIAGGKNPARDAIAAALTEGAK